MQTNKRLNTTLDRLPYGEDTIAENLKVNNTLPSGVKSSELYRDIIRIAWPSFIELLLTQLTSMADLMMVGSLGGSKNTQLGADALAAVGFTTQPKFLLMAAFIAMNTGVTALVARHKGNNDSKQANLVVRQGLLFTFCVTILLSVLGTVFAEPMVKFMGSTNPTITKWATEYLQIQMIGFISFALTSTITASLRAVGDSRTCMIYNLIANIVNVIFNYLLIYGHFGFPPMGVAGASLATVIGQFVAFFIAAFVLIRGNGFLKLQFKLGFRPNKKVLGNMVQIGIPAMIEQLLMRAGMIIFAKSVASLGDMQVAIHQICMNIQALSFMTGQAFAVSATTLMGQSLGKRRTDMAQAYCGRTRTVGFFFSLLLAAVFIFFGRGIVWLYNTTPEIVDIGGRIMLFVAFLQPFQSSQFIIAGGLRGAGDTKATALFTFITVLIIRPVFAILLIALGLDLYGAWAAMAIDQLIRSGLVLWRYNSGKWKLIKLKHQ